MIKYLGKRVCNLKKYKDTSKGLAAFTSSYQVIRNWSQNCMLSTEPYKRASGTRSPKQSLQIKILTYVTILNYQKFTIKL